MAASTEASGEAEARALRTLEGVARAMRLSPRTLKRRLADEGAAYSAILAECSATPRFCSCGSERSVEQIAEPGLLGRRQLHARGPPVDRDDARGLPALEAVTERRGGRRVRNSLSPRTMRHDPRQKTSPAVWFVAGVAAMLALVSAIGGYFVYRHEGRTVGTTTTSGAFSPLDLGAPPETYGGLSAAELARVTSARCAREERCGAVGPGKRYATRNTCETERAAQSSAFVPEARCPDGIAAGKSDACVVAIESTECAAYRAPRRAPGLPGRGPLRRAVTPANP